MRLYSYWRSSASWRVRIGLAHKGLSYEYHAVPLGPPGAGQQYQPEYREVNPLSQVPVLEVEAEGGRPRRISQSMAILDYLEERFPSPSLLPAELFLRARTRMLAEIVNAGIQPFQNTPTLAHVKHQLGGDEQAWARHFIARGLTALERSAAETAGTFLVGEQPTLADVCLVPQLYSARRFGVDLAPFPLLVRVEQACEALPAFAAARPERQPDAAPA
jgi:maleylpyruvate isomerase